MKGNSTAKGNVILLTLFFLSGMGCRATVAGDPERPIKIEAHITIDLRQVKETATSIEDMVSGKAQPQRQKSSFFGEGNLRGDWAVRSAWAEAPQLKYTTPEVQQAIDSRKDRYGQLKAYKVQGVVGEDNQGHVAALGGRADLQTLMEAENKDRETIYRAIVEQNNLSPDALSAIRATFAEVQREKSDPGDKIQLPSGEWTAK